MATKAKTKASRDAERKSAFAREGAAVLFLYLREHDDAKETARWVEEAGRRAITVARDVRTRPIVGRWSTARLAISAGSTSW